ncbi:glycosyltransferase family 2 protein [Cyanobium sp. LEGE 06113]|nr:glycosyltransferase family 2 protein [Cyanobium sp. LEGE 06113]
MVLPRLVMTLLVRNEDDIIEDTILFHHAQGVDAFVVMDNLSTDRTREVLRDLAGEIVIDYIHQPEDNYAQGEWVTLMARKAFLDHAADWVINSDADEFWLVKSQATMKQLLAGLPEDVCALAAKRYNAVLRQRDNNYAGASAHPRVSTFFRHLSCNALGAPLPPKCLHRGSTDVIVQQGNHSAEGIRGSTQESDDLYILHYPYRSFARYQSKISLGGDAYQRNTSLPESLGHAWREHHRLLRGEGLRDFWSGLHVSDNELLLLSLTHELFEEGMVVDVLAQQRRWWQGRLLKHAIDKLEDSTRHVADQFYARIAERAMATPPEDRDSDPFLHNLRFTTRGAKSQSDFISNLKHGLSIETLPSSLAQLRDGFSLFPSNDALVDFLRSLLLLQQPDEARALKDDLDKDFAFMHVTCEQRLGAARRTLETFQSPASRYGNILVVGDPMLSRQDQIPLGFRYRDGVLTIPVADSYEALATKVFVALLIIHLVGSPAYLVKLDDDIGLASSSSFEKYLGVISACEANYAGRPISLPLHRQQLHGWHIGKCQDQELHSRGYQYPLPPTYAAGGHGYVLGRSGVEACAYMFMAMKSFFAMPCVELEDVFVGHAMAASGIALNSKGIDMPSLALPGLCKLST